MQALLHGYKVVHVALFDLENLVQDIRAVNGVARPGNVAEIILAPLVKLHVNIEVLAILGEIHRIFYQAGIPVTGFVEGVQYGFAVFLVFLLLEFLGFEEVIPLGRVGFLHVLGQLVFFHIRISAEIDVLDADFPALVHIKVHADGTADHGILLHLGVHRYFKVALFLIIPFDDIFGSILHIV